MTLYSLKNLKKRYNGRTVLDIDALEIREGTVYSLSGPNGAGKSTFLNIIGFLLTPSSGQLYYKDALVTQSEKFLHLLRQSVILVDQHPILFSCSVYKNIEFGLKVRKIPRAARKKIITEVLDLVDLKDFIHSDARTLSGGETRRIAIARAIACSPAVLLLDEPTADLDLESRLSIEQIIHRICHRNNITIVFCTHDLAQAARLTDHNIYFLNGRVHDVYHENVFKGDRVIAENPYQCYCKIKENLLIPVPPTDKNKIKISIHPDAVRITGREKSKEDCSTSFCGTVTQLVSEKDKIRGLIDIGVPISILIHKSEYDFHMIRINDTVNLVFDVGGITIL